jgi:hypothetical protein
LCVELSQLSRVAAWKQQIAARNPAAIPLHRKQGGDLKMTRRKSSVRAGAAIALLAFAALGLNLGSTESAKSENEKLTPFRILTPKAHQCQQRCLSRATACYQSAKENDAKEACENYAITCQQKC